MNMNSIYIQMPNQLNPFETPFEKSGYPSQPCQFIFLNNRTTGRYSGLLPIDYNWVELGWKLADYFPEGHTNLIRIEKVYAAHPDKSSFKQDNRKTPKVYCPKSFDPSHIVNLYYVYREPISIDSKDIIGMMYSVQKGISMANRYATTYGRRSVVGRILKIQTWH